MKRLIGLALAAVALVGTGGYLARARLRRLPVKMESAMEKCPPIRAMRNLEEQSTEMIDLLRDHNALFGIAKPATSAVSKPG